MVFGLGGNLGDSEAILRWALGRLECRFGPLRVAPAYRTEARAPEPQPDYLNTVAIAAAPPASAPREPRRVLAVLKRLEARAGRRHGRRHGPRPLDVDLLLLGDTVVRLGPLATPGEPAAERWPGAVSVPHPALRRRCFVLAPLCDLAPDLTLPPDGARPCDLLGDVAEQRVERVGWSAGPPSSPGPPFLPALDAV